MKGLTLSATLLASLLAISTAAVAQESQEIERKDYSNSGVDSAQDIDMTSDRKTDMPVKDSDLDPNSGIDSGKDVNPTSGNGSAGQPQDQDGLAPNSGIDSGHNVNPGSNSN
nr:hypothetical protein [uncultured Halomonas sp.]